jgi:hypothetical protein
LKNTIRSFSGQHERGLSSTHAGDQSQSSLLARHAFQLSSAQLFPLRQAAAVSIAAERAAASAAAGRAIAHHRISAHQPQPALDVGSVGSEVTARTTPRLIARGA